MKDNIKKIYFQLMPGLFICFFLYLFILRSTKYKTSVLYGQKLLIFDQSLFAELTTYVNCVRPTQSPFVSYSLVSKGVTSSFQKAEIFKPDDNMFLSPTRFRVSIATVCVGTEHLRLLL